MIIDLHTHTTASDGALSPQELWQRAGAAGIDLLSITDHDTVAAYTELEPRTRKLPVLIPGVEFSTTWQTIGVHVLGLNVDLDSDALTAATNFQHAARQRRAEHIAARLARVGVANALVGAREFAAGAGVGRPHFAQHLVRIGLVQDVGQAFKKYLGAGKIGDVKQHWASLEQIIDWIRGANGTAVLAHPGKYGLTRTKRLRLIEDFRQSGGQGIEIISGRQDPALTAALSATAQSKNLLVSCGSDFHRINQPWAQLGMAMTPPPQCRPVWANW